MSRGNANLPNWGVPCENSRVGRPGACLFDLDCTLTDRMASIAAFAGRFVDHFGGILRWDGHAKLKGDRFVSPITVVAATITSADANGYAPRLAVFARMRRELPWTHRPDAETLKCFWVEVFPTCTRPGVGLHDTLLSLREQGVRLGVVSNGGESAQEQKIDALGIRSHFSTVVISGAVGVRKPDPRIFHLALDGVSARAAECWMVGDHPVLDIAGARDAGLRPVWLRGVHAWPHHMPYPDAQIDRLPDVLHLLRGTSRSRPWSS